MIAVTIVALIVAALTAAGGTYVSVQSNRLASTTNDLLRADNADLLRAVLARNLGEFDRPEQTRTTAQANAAMRLLEVEEKQLAADVME